MNPTGRIVLIGVGNVGASLAFALLQQDFVSKILLIDTNQQKTTATSLDLQDSSGFHRGIPVDVGSYASIQDGDVVVISCGKAQQEGQTRLDLFEVNREILNEVCENLNKTQKKIYVVVLSNPVDLLTQFTIKTLNLRNGLVFGTGTYLDTIRLRNFLGRKLNLNPKNINAFVLGEHGDSSFAVLSSASVNGVDLTNFLKLTPELYTEVNSNVREQAYKIIEGKGVSCFGIACAVVDILRSIILDEGLILPLSVPLNGIFEQHDICMGIPVVLTSNGFKYVKEPNLNEIERGYLDQTLCKLKSFLC